MSLHVSGKTKLPLCRVDPEVLDRVRSEFSISKNCVADKLHRLLKYMVRKHNTTISEFKSGRRFKELVRARNEFCYEALIITKANCAQIGRVIGRDATFVRRGANSYATEHGLKIPNKENRQARR